MTRTIERINYLYTYSWDEGEHSLCQLEMRSLFGFDTESTLLESTLRIDPSRSPFMKERIDILYRCNSLEELVQNVKDLRVNTTFKVLFVKNGEKVSFNERRSIERKIGLEIQGTVDLVNPQAMFGIIKVKEGWIFGQYFKSEPIWLHHQKKPRNYSTALGTRVARAVVNIAVPQTHNIKAIDPCCGIGTVLIEALSMNIDIVGSDINPLAAIGARENLSYFGLEGDVILKDIRNVIGRYDVAIIDMPYNHCSVLEPEMQLEMLQSARKFATKVVIITVETIDVLLDTAGFEIIARCIAQKGQFTRQVIVCQ
ncbi:TRM11 family SAM-dependent methyltransferase [Bacillus sp. FJAT-45350]|uniref:TRM11 family SAM-dependent methyltransferase n=1 Tax=Bacillus sp. FJAT-45350 TaxID=2011014 RepID=UPI000BB9B74C|nr:methyltransferase [Bacillus sp. FJAT-45350]